MRISYLLGAIWIYAEARNLIMIFINFGKTNSLIRNLNDIVNSEGSESTDNLRI